MHYLIKHLTRYRYTAPVHESFLEVRLQPRSEGPQRCWRFKLETSPRAKSLWYRDHLGNTVHHFDIPGRHGRLLIHAESQVEVAETPPWPASVDSSTWDVLDDLARSGEFWDTLHPSPFIASTDLLTAFVRELGIERRDDPLTFLRTLNAAISDAFAYVPQSTRVDSPIDDALKARRGVCQDFAHIMIAAARGLGIPCRYVSGYLYHRFEDQDRSAEDASHAWVEAYLPGLGWIGFDPTNNILAGIRHIRVAIGRDYSDVPPTKGVFKGEAQGEVSVSVQVTLADAAEEEEFVTASTTSGWIVQETSDEQLSASQQQQQQQQ